MGLGDHRAGRGARYRPRSFESTGVDDGCARDRGGGKRPFLPASGEVVTDGDVVGGDEGDDRSPQTATARLIAPALSIRPDTAINESEATVA